MKVKANPIVATIPFDEDGVHHGYLRLPYSHDESAWGSVMIPITVVRNGDGPTALLTGANHGDEYEGPVALQSLAHSLKATDIQGRVIIVPAFNYPAFRAGTRTSPIDKGNLNRLFPGRPDGTVTEKIADYFQRTLIPMADIVLDIHAGGKTLDFVPFCAAHILEDKQQQAACVAAMQAFNAPYSIMLLEIDNVGMYDTAVEEQGKVFISTELGGGGTSTARSNRIAKKGVRNVLIHAGILRGEPEMAESHTLDMTAESSTLFSENDGLVEFCFDLGETVAVGDVLARVWPAERSGADPVDYIAGADGILAARHFPGLIKGGDFLAMIARVEG
ncbi:MAG: N(2)-acetyl-L-2,4-diaminobutanoate deacetylase DoeB [Thiolinea sp.]